MFEKAQLIRTTVCCDVMAMLRGSSFWYILVNSFCSCFHFLNAIIMFLFWNCLFPSPRFTWKSKHRIQGLWNRWEFGVLLNKLHDSNPNFKPDLALSMYFPRLRRVLCVLNEPLTSGSFHNYVKYILFFYNRNDRKSKQNPVVLAAVFSSVPVRC